MDKTLAIRLSDPLPLSDIWTADGVSIKARGTTLADARFASLSAQRRDQSIAMLPSWIIVLSAIELIGFLAFALSIVTAAPEETLIRVSSAPDSRKTLSI